jgi:hypothetical protein
VIKVGIFQLRLNEKRKARGRHYTEAGAADQWYSVNNPMRFFSPNQISRSAKECPVPQLKTYVGSKCAARKL